MIYIIHFFIVSSLYIIFGRNKQTQKWFVYSSFVYVIFVFGQRWMTGTDFPGYLRYYMTDYVRGEWGYFGLQTLLAESGLYFGLLIFVILLLTQVNFYRFFLKLENYSLMIFIFLISEIFFAQMSQIRQYVAISFFINSYYNSYNKEYFKSILNIILAYSFHTAAIFFVPLLFIKLPLNRKNILALLKGSVILPFLDIHFLFKLPLFSRYSHYVDGRFDVPLGSSHYIKYYAILLFLLFFMHYLKTLDKNRIYNMILNGSFLYILIYGLSFQFAPLYRIATFFQVFEIVLLVSFASKLKVLPAIFTKRVISFLFIGIFAFSALADSYNVASYQFRPLKFHEDKTREEMLTDIEVFYDE